MFLDSLEGWERCPTNVWLFRSSVLAAGNCVTLLGHLGRKGSCAGPVADRACLWILRKCLHCVLLIVPFPFFLLIPKNLWKQGGAVCMLIALFLGYTAGLWGRGWKTMLPDTGRGSSHQTAGQGRIMLCKSKSLNFAPLRSKDLPACLIDMVKQLPNSITLPI